MEKKAIESFLKNEIKDSKLQERALHLLNNIYQYIVIDKSKIDREKVKVDKVKKAAELKKIREENSKEVQKKSPKTSL